MSEIRCTSPYCVRQDNVRGRMFTPDPEAKGLASVWCPKCIELGTQIQFFSTETANMIRTIYRQYKNTELPKEVLLILEQFTREVIQQLGEEL